MSWNWLLAWLYDIYLRNHTTQKNLEPQRAALNNIFKNWEIVNFGSCIGFQDVSSIEPYLIAKCNLLILCLDFCAAYWCFRCCMEIEGKISPLLLMTNCFYKVSNVPSFLFDEHSSVPCTLQTLLCSCDRCTQMEVVPLRVPISLFS